MPRLLELRLSATIPLFIHRAFTNYVNNLALTACFGRTFTSPATLFAAAMGAAAVHSERRAELGDVLNYARNTELARRMRVSLSSAEALLPGRFPPDMDVTQEKPLLELQRPKISGVRTIKVPDANQC